MHEDIKELYHYLGTFSRHVHKNFNVITSSCNSTI